MRRIVEHSIPSFSLSLAARAEDEFRPTHTAIPATKTHDAKLNNAASIRIILGGRSHSPSQYITFIAASPPNSMANPQSHPMSTQATARPTNARVSGTERGESNDSDTRSATRKTDRQASGTTTRDVTNAMPINQGNRNETTQNDSA